jgi:nucleoid-associated protein YgaU
VAAGIFAEPPTQAVERPTQTAAATPNPAPTAPPPGPAVPVPRVEQQALATPAAATAPAATPPATAAPPPPTVPLPPAVAAAPAPAPTPAAPAQVPPAAPVAVAALPATIAPPATMAPTQPGPATVAPPTFDIVRINPQGRAVIAGRAPANAEVTINASDEVVAVTRANAFGEWVAIPDHPLPRGPREITLLAATPNGERVGSEQVVTVVIPSAGAPAEERAVAVLQDRGGAGAPRVLQGGVNDEGVRAGALTLDAVQYDELGNLVLAGKARLGTQVQVFVDDRPVGIAAADAGGLWQMTPGNAVTIGRHQLRLEQVDPAGALVARMDLPFLRAAPDEIRALAPGEVIVQPGSTLWQIARGAYGRGTLYTVIYLANADQITNPDLIYPGQIFTLPPAR